MSERCDNCSFWHNADKCPEINRISGYPRFPARDKFCEKYEMSKEVLWEVMKADHE